jgi:hypothetical protein
MHTARFEPMSYLFELRHANNIIRKTIFLVPNPIRRSLFLGRDCPQRQARHQVHQLLGRTADEADDQSVLPVPDGLRRRGRRQQQQLVCRLAVTPSSSGHHCATYLRARDLRKSRIVYSCYHSFSFRTILKQ